MSNLETIFQYSSDNRFVPIKNAGQKIWIADSWLVKDGRSRALHLHKKRFCTSCFKLAGISFETTDRIWQLALDKIPRTGSWFPRIELIENSRLYFFQIRIRQAPSLHSTIRLMNCPVEDLRKAPRHKGPDLSRLALIRKNILEQGADEGILRTPKAYLLEGLTTNIMWWENETLCTTPPNYRVLQGITCQLLRLIALQKNTTFAYRFRKMEELKTCEVWAVNALHGIRRTTEWEHSSWNAPNHIDITEWTKYLDDFMENLSTLKK